MIDTDRVEPEDIDIVIGAALRNGMTVEELSDTLIVWHEIIEERHSGSGPQ